MYGHILYMFEECNCAVCNVNTAIQTGKNTRTNKVSWWTRSIVHYLEY